MNVTTIILITTTVTYPNRLKLFSTLHVAFYLSYSYVSLQPTNVGDFPRTLRTTMVRSMSYSKKIVTKSFQQINRNIFFVISSSLFFVYVTYTILSCNLVSRPKAFKKYLLAINLNCYFSFV